MQTIEKLIAELRRRDVRIWREGQQLRLNAPSQALTASLRAEISARKAEILAHLAGESDGAPNRPPIPRLDRGGRLPLSFVQERLWFLHQLDPGGSAHNIAIGIDISGSMDVDVLERSLTEVLRRHEVLRSTFTDRDGDPECLISPPSGVELQPVDLSGLLPAEAEREAERRMREETRRSFDLERGPLVRFLLLRQAEDRSILVITQPHIITDRWSLGVISRELGTLYRAFIKGEQSPLSDLPIQYADFAAWQRDRLQGDELERQLAFWTEQVKDPVPALTLPTDRPRPAFLTTASSTVSMVMPPGLRDHLSDLGREENCSPFMVLLAAFQALLSRHTGQQDILVGSPVAGRVEPELEDLAGCFINTLVLRTNLTGEPTFRDLLGRVRNVVLGALDHQDLPFEKLVEEADPRRDPSRSPLVQVTFAYQNLPTAVELPERVGVIATGGSDFDLSLYAVDTAAGLHVTLEYNQVLFDEATAVLILDRYRLFLEEAVARPDQVVSQIPLLTEGERAQIGEWNSTERDRSRDETVCDLFEHQAATQPDRVAVSCEGHSLTYAELSRRSSQLAEHLVQLGVGRQTAVAVAIDRSIDLVVGLLGVLKSGAFYVPLDPSHPPSRLGFMVRDAGATIVLTKAALADRFSELSAHLVAIDSDWIVEKERRDSPMTVPRGEDLAYVIYTSGSTGKPKGVEVAHASLTNFLYSMARYPGMDEEDLLVAVTTVSFDIAALELFLPLTLGARVVIATTEQASDGVLLAALLAHSEATVMQATPATWRLLLDADWKGDPRLKILCGGATLDRDLADELLARGSALWNLYGPTETTIWSSLEPMGTGADPVTIGRPIDNTQVLIVDELGQLVPVGVPGEIFIGGAGVARGYRGRPELTEERFIPDPTGGVPGGRLYRTGDLGRYRSDGRLEYLGRIDHQIKIRGFRIEPGEVEAILRSHSAVRDAAVVVRADRLVAFVVYEKEMEPTVTEVRRFLGGELPEYMVPAWVVPLHALPLTLNGKLDRSALPDPFERRDIPEEEYIPPATDQERLVAAVWQGLLGIDRIGVHDNFYEVGGHSLLSMRVVRAIEQQTGHRLDPRVMFFQSVRQIASTLPESVRALV